MGPQEWPWPDRITRCSWLCTGPFASADPDLPSQSHCFILPYISVTSDHLPVSGKCCSFPGFPVFILFWLLLISVFCTSTLQLQRVEMVSILQGSAQLLYRKYKSSFPGFFRPSVLTLPVAVLVSASFLEYKLLEGVNHVLYILVFPARPFLSELAIQGMAPDHIPVTPCGRRSGQILAVRECPGQLSNGFQASLGCVPGTGLCKARGKDVLWGRSCMWHR